MLRVLLGGLSIVLLFPSVLFFGLVWVIDRADWNNEQVLFVKRHEPSTQVVVQSRNAQFATLSTSYRTVQLTPMLDLWQRIEPVDTATFDTTGWQRVPQ